MTSRESQQEVRLLAMYSKDKNLIQVFKENKDIYASIASKIYKNDYWDNMEHKEDGTPNPEGKKRRNFCKALQLGIAYQMGPAHLAEDTHKTFDEAKQIIDDFYKNYKETRKWMDETIAKCHKTGIVQDWYGRVRHLPDIQLPRYEVMYKDANKNTNSQFNPFLGCKDRAIKNEELEGYLQKCYKCKGNKEFDTLQKAALMKGIIIKNNSGLIAAAERRSINSPIQGGAATMTKRTMVRIANDKILNELGFHLLLPVHDELIGECPKENAQKVAERFTHIMRTSMEDVTDVPIKSDSVIEDNWYFTDYCDSLQKEYDELKQSKGEQEAYNILKEEHTEILEDTLKEILAI